MTSTLGSAWRSMSPRGSRCDFFSIAPLVIRIPAHRRRSSHRGQWLRDNPWRRPRARSFWETWRNRADAERALSAWYKIASNVEWANFAGLKQTFGSADQVGNCVVFDIGNNRYRLIGRVLYPHKLYVLRVMDHEEYDRVPWASPCGCHSPPPKRRTPPTKRPGAVRRRRR